MPAAVELKLFGGFEGRLAGGEAIDLAGQKDRALLAILALSPGTSHPRDKLASLLWSERGDEQARDSLKHALTRLRQVLQPASPPPMMAISVYRMGACLCRRWQIDASTGKKALARDIKVYFFRV